MMIYNKNNISIYRIESEADVSEVMGVIDVDSFDIESILDPDEISRIEFYLDEVFIIWKKPRNFKAEGSDLRLEVCSVGIYLNMNEQSLTIVSEDDIDFKAADQDSVIDFLLKFLFTTTKHFVGHLKTVKQITMDLESKIITSMENKYLLHMFTLGESLTYYLTAIEANSAVLNKLMGRIVRLKLNDDQVELLEDVMQESNQCVRQVQIYSSVLSGLMDARGTIVNNNMNVLLKNLTLINVIFLPLNLLASIGGMSEYSMMTAGIPWWISYPLFLLSMCMFGGITWFLLKYVKY